MVVLKEWRELKDDFNDTLIVGNGGSIAVSTQFQYNRLYDYGCKHELIKPKAVEVFDQFSKGLRDFEGILYRLWQADFINEKFEIAEIERKKVRKAYTDVRRALIDTVKGVHPVRSSLSDDKLRNIGCFLAEFTNVFSLNYDLTVYWALLKTKDILRTRFYDGFTTLPNRKQSSSISKLLFDKDLKTPAKDDVTNVYYPHGNLALYQTIGGEESKLVSNKSGLLAAITERWQRNDGQPIFVCEGSATDKVANISKSNYLSHVFLQELPAFKKSVTVYGWGMGRQDTHILEQLAKAKCGSAAVSVFRTGKSDKQIVKEINHMQEMLGEHANIVEVHFFDASSAGCWTN